MKCLIIGANSNLAKELCSIKDKYGIEYISTNRNILNITNEDSVAGYKMSYYNDLKHMDAIVHCAAYTNVLAAEKEKCKAIDANVIGTRNISKYFGIFNMPIVYISTDYVYSGLVGNYRETDVTRPVNFYAMTKLAGEAYIDKPNDLIIRTSFKPLSWKYDVAFDDLYTSADYIDIIAEKISFLIINKAAGIYNVGTERKTIYELAKRRNNNVRPISKNTVVGVYLPEDISMNTKKYDGLVASIRKSSQSMV